LRTQTKPSKGQYGVLAGDDGERDIGRRLRHVEEEEGDNIGFDVSGFEGPIALRKMNTRDPDEGEEELDSAHAGLAAEFHRLESGQKPGMLGGGMVSVLEAPFTYNTPQPQEGHHHHHPHLHGHGHNHGHRRVLSNSNPPAREEAQKEAEKTGEILAVIGTVKSMLSYMEQFAKHPCRSTSC
jgi:hypothetical protein